MRLVAARAVARDPSVGRIGFVAVAVGAARAIRLARMGLVTVGALCVPVRSKAVLFGMTRLACDYRFSVVRVMTGCARLVSGRDKTLLFPVAASARLVEPLRMMRKPPMAAAAILVPSMPVYLGNIFLVAMRAERSPHVAELELMGSMTLATTRLAMKRRFASG